MIKSLKLRYLLYNHQNFVTLLFLRHVVSSIPVYLLHFSKFYGKVDVISCIVFNTEIFDSKSFFILMKKHHKATFHSKNFIVENNSLGF